MTAPNLFLTYVTDVERATAFYRDLFELEPVMLTPRYVPFEIAPGVTFAVWGARAEAVASDPVRTSEIGLNLEGGPAAIEARHAEWVAKGVRIVEPPHDDVFGRTFVAADPDGNLIRVSPVD